jgi:hypothetical protein
MTTNFKLFFESVKQLPLFFILKHKESGVVYGIKHAYSAVTPENIGDSQIVQNDSARLVLMANMIGVHRSLKLTDKGRAITLDQLSTSGTFDAALDIM